MAEKVQCSQRSGQPEGKHYSAQERTACAFIHEQERAMEPAKEDENSVLGK